MLSRIEGRRLGRLDVGGLLVGLLLWVLDGEMLMGLLSFVVEDGLPALLVVARLLFGEVGLLEDGLLVDRVVLVLVDGIVGWLLLVLVGCWLLLGRLLLLEWGGWVDWLILILEDGLLVEMLVLAQLLLLGDGL